MAKRRTWQRGTADMVSIGMGLLILGIVTAGTSAAMVYGREALIRQEHYKAAAYILRGKMEQVQAELQLIPEARSGRNTGERTYEPEPLDNPSRERGVNNWTQPVMVTVLRDPIDEMDDLRNGPRSTRTPPDYRILTMRARWHERDLAEGSRNPGGVEREITFTTAVLVRAEL